MSLGHSLTFSKQKQKKQKTHQTFLFDGGSIIGQTYQIRASASMNAKFFPFCTSKIYFFYFTLLFLQNTHISLSIIHIYSNKIFISLTLSSLSQTQHHPHSHHSTTHHKPIGKKNQNNHIITPKLDQRHTHTKIGTNHNHIPIPKPEQLHPCHRTNQPATTI